VKQRENLVSAMISGFKSAQPSEGIRRSHAWLGVIMLVLVAAFWIGYPATGLVPPSDSASQAEHHDDDDD